MTDEQPPAPAVEEASDKGYADLAADWLRAVGDRFQTGAQLAIAETRLALSSFVLMIMLTVLAAGAILFAWGFLVIALAQLPIAMGMSRAATALVLVAVHLLIAFVLWRVINALGRNMEFAETRKLFRAASDAAPDEDDDGR
jgi:flagellar biosynthesis protein FliP